MVVGYKVVEKAAWSWGEKVSMFPSKHKAVQYAMYQANETYGVEVYRCYENGSECKIHWDYRGEWED